MGLRLVFVGFYAVIAKGCQLFIRRFRIRRSRRFAKRNRKKRLLRKKKLRKEFKKYERIRFARKFARKFKRARRLKWRRWFRRAFIRYVFTGELDKDFFEYDARQHGAFFLRKFRRNPPVLPIRLPSSKAYGYNT